jgi:hypothetical protein
MPTIHLGRPRSQPDRRIEILQKRSTHPGLWSITLSVHYDDASMEIEEPILATIEDAMVRAERLARHENIDDIVVLDES